MDKIKTSKKTIVIAAAICAVMAVGGALAYFTDYDEAENNISIGEVTIDLTEPVWDSYEDSDEDGVPDEAEDIVPTQTISKDPMVTNTGINDAYVYLTVSVPKAEIYTANKDGTKNEKAVTQLFTYEASDNWTLLESSTSDSDVNTYTYGYNYILSAGESTDKLFESVTFCNAIEGQGLENTVQNINIKAMGIQSDGTGTMEEAYSKYVNQNQ